MAAEGNNIRRYIYMGEEDEEIPDDGTEIIVVVHEDVTVILAHAFDSHDDIIEVICHEGVEKIEEFAFYYCGPSLRRVIMPGVEIVEMNAFSGCDNLTDVQCGKLKIIRGGAFAECKSLRSINLPSVEIVNWLTFQDCTALTDVKFSNKLERIEGGAFLDCPSLERITIPLKHNFVTDDEVFMGCESLKHVDLVEGALHETISALLLDDWRNDMNELIDSINHILPNANAGGFDAGGFYELDDEGEKARVIRRWIRSLLLKIIHYQAEHQRFVSEAGSTLHHALPHDIVMNNILPFLVLPSYTFEVEDDQESDSDDELEDYEESDSDDDMVTIVHV